MTPKKSAGATDWREINRWEHGVGWIAHPDETMQRASHAIEVDGDVWVIDPVDADGVDDLLEDLGTVVGVVVLLDRHTRDARTIADRYDVPVFVPQWMSGVEKKIGVSTERLHTALGDTGYGVHELYNNSFWQEAMLYGEDSGVLVVSEALGTAPYYLTKDERLGVHPALRLFPPKKPGRLSPDRILVGHGAGIDERVSETLDDALSNARARTPSLYAKATRQLLPL